MSNLRYKNGRRRRQIRARHQAIGAPCALCGKPINYELPAGHPMAFEVDEIIPVSRGGSPIEWANTQATHRSCNQSKGAGGRRFQATHRSGLPTSRDW